MGSLKSSSGPDGGGVLLDPFNHVGVGAAPTDEALDASLVPGVASLDPAESARPLIDRTLPCSRSAAVERLGGGPEGPSRAKVAVHTERPECPERLSGLLLPRHRRLLGHG
jgi:hypothetical protein